MPIAEIIAKFREDQYERLLRVCEDCANLPDSYAVWLKTVENLMQYHARRGTAVYTVDVDLDELIGWCEAEDLKVNNDSLLRFVDYRVERIQMFHSPPHRISASDFADSASPDSEDSEFEN